MAFARTCTCNLKSLAKPRRTIQAGHRNRRHDHTDYLDYQHIDGSRGIGHLSAEMPSVPVHSQGKHEVGRKRSRRSAFWAVETPRWCWQSRSFRSRNDVFIEDNHGIPMCAPPPCTLVDGVRSIIGEPRLYLLSEDGREHPCMHRHDVASKHLFQSFRRQTCLLGKFSCVLMRYATRGFRCPCFPWRPRIV